MLYDVEGLIELVEKIHQLSQEGLKLGPLEASV
jgi:hypothetical protein